MILWGIRILFFPNSELYAKAGSRRLHHHNLPAGGCAHYGRHRFSGRLAGGNGYWLKPAAASSAPWAPMVCTALWLGGRRGGLVSFTFIGMFLVMNISLRQFVQWLAKSAKSVSPLWSRRFPASQPESAAWSSPWAHRQPRPNLNRKNRRLPFTIIKAGYRRGGRAAGDNACYPRSGTGSGRVR